MARTIDEIKAQELGLTSDTDALMQSAANALERYKQPELKKQVLQHLEEALKSEANVGKSFATQGENLRNIGGVAELYYRALDKKVEPGKLRLDAYGETVDLDYLTKSLDRSVHETNARAHSILEIEMKNLEAAASASVAANPAAQTAADVASVAPEATTLEAAAPVEHVPGSEANSVTHATEPTKATIGTEPAATVPLSSEIPVVPTPDAAKVESTLKDKAGTAARTFASKVRSGGENALNAISRHDNAAIIVPAAIALASLAIPNKERPVVEPDGTTPDNGATEKVMGGGKKLALIGGTVLTAGAVLNKVKGPTQGWVAKLATKIGGELGHAI